MAASLNFTFENIFEEGFIRVAFDPYLSIFGNFTWGLIFGFIGAGLYVNERSIAIALTYLVLVGIFFSIVFPAILIYLFGLVLAFVLASTLYTGLVERRID